LDRTGSAAGTPAEADTGTGGGRTCFGFFGSLLPRCRLDIICSFVE
jgi:hypothetical protein